MISLNGRSGVFLRTKDHSIRETTPSRIDSVIKINPEKAPEESVKPRIHSESENVQKSSPAKSSGEIRLVGNESEISDSAPTARYQQCQWNTAHAVTAVPPTPSPYGNLVDGIISLNLFYR